MSVFTTRFLSLDGHATGAGRSNPAVHWAAVVRTRLADHSPCNCVDSCTSARADGCSWLLCVVFTRSQHLQSTHMATRRRLATVCLARLRRVNSPFLVQFSGCWPNTRPKRSKVSLTSFPRCSKWFKATSPCPIPLLVVAASAMWAQEVILARHDEPDQLVENGAQEEDWLAFWGPYDGTAFRACLMV